MRSLLFFFLRLIKWFRGVTLKIIGKKEEDIAAERIVTGQSWNEFCDNLKAAGASLMYPGTPRDGFQQAEGIRYLSRLTRAGLEAFVEYNDPNFPIFRRTVHETIKMGADNPDNYYLNAQIDGKNDYLISGNRNSIFYFGVFSQNGNYATTGGLAPCGMIDDKELITEADGSFEISVSKERRGKNWLKIEEDSSLIMIRQTFLKRQNEIPVEIHIKAINGPDKPELLSAAKIDNDLKTAGLFVGGASLLFSKWAKGFQKNTNQLPLFDPVVSNAAGGDKDITYYHSHWKLKDEECLVIEVMPPLCLSWNFQLNNYWMESLDYRYHNICVSKGNAVFEKDGTIKVIVAHKDPHLPNWIETAGHTEGTMCWRWYKPVGNAPQPKTKVELFDGIANEF